MLITLPDNWDTFCTNIRTNPTADGLSLVIVKSSLLTEEVNRKNVEISKNGSALMVCGRSTKRGKGRERNKSQSKSRARSNVECYHCHKKGHLKKDCYKWKREKGKGKKEHNQKEEKKASSVKIEEVNTINKDEEGDIIFISTIGSIHLVATNQGISNDWVLDSGASFHVNPNCDWFTNYDKGRIGQARLGNGIACDIVNVSDV